MWHYRLMSASKWRLKYIFYNLNKMFNCLNAIQSFLLLFIFSYCGYSACWKFVLSNLSHIILFADMANIINIFRKGLLFLVYFYFEITQPRKNSHYILKKKKCRLDIMQLKRMHQSFVWYRHDITQCRKWAAG